MSIRPKRVTKPSIVGEQGIALIHQRVLDMGYLWYPTGSLEAGIDGLIELRDPDTRVVRNCIVQVQSKATGERFDNETDSEFVFVCDERDLDYWLNGNGPVILVRSRPKTQEAYWVSIKDYFDSPSKRKNRKILFNKRTDKFDSSARQAIWTLAVPKDAGIFLPPLPKTELLYSNALPVVGFADTIYVAETQYRTAGQLWPEFNKRNVRVGSEWFLKNERLFSFHPLDQFPFSDVCESGTIERFSTNEWASSDSADRLRDFVRLLNQCLSEKLFRIGVRFDRQRNQYYFGATKDLSTRREAYLSLNKRRAHRDVFKGYASNFAPDRITYYRHSAFEGQFVTFNRSWFLQITPTYRFTWDGYHIDGRADDRLAWIKRLERNSAVLGQLAMWAALLSKPPDLFRHYPFLQFGALQPFRLEHGIDDALWLPAEEPEEAANLNVDEEGLFA